PGPRGGVVAGADDPVERRGRHVEYALPLPDPLAMQHVVPQPGRDRPHVAARQPAERNDPIEPVEELRAEELLRGPGVGSRRGRAPVAEPDLRLRLADPEVRRQDYEGVGEVRGAAEGVGEPALAEDLK